MNIRHKPLTIALLVASIFISFLNVNIVGAQNTALEPVTIQLRWFHQFQFAGYYAAIEKGFYAEEGLQVSLRVFEPGKDRIAPVLEGKAQYGVGDPALLKLRVQGQPVVVLAQIFQHSPAVLITKRESGIFSPDELVDKKVMLPADDISSVAIHAMLLETFRDLDPIDIIPQTYDPVDLINGRVDAMSGYLSNEPYKMRKRGFEVNIIDPGINLLFYKNNEAALRAVDAGQAFAFIGGILSTPIMINEFGLKNLKASAPSALPDGIVSMGVRNDWPELRDIINKTLVAMPAEEKAAIISKRSTVRIEYGIRPADIIKWILVFGGGASGLVLLFFFWNRSLATKVRERTVELERSNKSLAVEVLQRTEAEKLLRESRDYLKNLTDSLPDAVFSIKMPDRKIEWANDTFKVFGY
jgi:ABC-type amino acid transport substrate-binding protein